MLADPQGALAGGVVARNTQIMYGLGLPKTPGESDGGMEGMSDSGEPIFGFSADALVAPAPVASPELGSASVQQTGPPAPDKSPTPSIRFHGQTGDLVTQAEVTYLDRKKSVIFNVS